MQDLKQVRLLVSRMLLDNGVGVEASKIRATLLDDEITKAQLHLS
ncbi:hypothetical protein [Sphingomonas citricola]|nr:hypothetical protein [Sphingomonas citricola]